MPDGLDDQLFVRQIQVLADGACDALALVFFEMARGDLKSAEWLDRQMRKVNGVLVAADELMKKSGRGKFLVCNEFSVADIALGSMLGMMSMIEKKFGIVQFLEKYPDLKSYWEWLEERQSFKDTQPEMFELTEKVA